ncbi:hypothetical protein KOY_00262 [Bacillus cereus VDM021]|nr:hypothetical protein KOY_00262 [Bacillus cereus VDM021]
MKGKDLVLLFLKRTKIENKRGYMLVDGIIKGKEIKETLEQHQDDTVLNIIPKQRFSIPV